MRNKRRRIKMKEKPTGMRMPGFTAEATLYKVGGRYRQQAAGLNPSNDGIMPAATCCAPCGRDLCCDECGSDGGPPDDPHDPNILGLGRRVRVRHLFM